MLFQNWFSFNTFSIKNIFSLKSHLKPYGCICCLHYELHKSNHTGLDQRIAFHWLWLKDNGKSHWPGTVLRFISLLSFLWLRLVPKTDTWSHDFCNSSYSSWCHVRVSSAFLCGTGCPLLLYSCERKTQELLMISNYVLFRGKKSTKQQHKKLQYQTALWRKRKLHLEKSANKSNKSFKVSWSLTLVKIRRTKTHRKNYISPKPQKVFVL